MSPVTSSNARSSFFTSSCGEGECRSQHLYPHEMMYANLRHVLRNASALHLRCCSTCKQVIYGLALLRAFMSTLVEGVAHLSTLHGN